MDNFKVFNFKRSILGFSRNNFKFLPVAKPSRFIECFVVVVVVFFLENSLYLPFRGVRSWVKKNLYTEEVLVAVWLWIVGISVRCVVDGRG